MVGPLIGIDDIICLTGINGVASPITDDRVVAAKSPDDIPIPGAIDLVAEVVAVVVVGYECHSRLLSAVLRSVRVARRCETSDDGSRTGACGFQPRRELSLALHWADMSLDSGARHARRWPRNSEQRLAGSAAIHAALLQSEATLTQREHTWIAGRANGAAPRACRR